MTFDTGTLTEPGFSFGSWTLGYNASIDNYDIFQSNLSSSSTITKDIGNFNLISFDVVFVNNIPGLTPNTLRIASDKGDEYVFTTNSLTTHTLNWIGVNTITLTRIGGNGLGASYDNFVYTNCVEGEIMSLSASPASIAPGESSTITINGNLNSANEWHIYTESCGGTLVGTTNTNTFVVNPSLEDMTYYIRGEDDSSCLDESTISCSTIEILLDDSVPFRYFVKTDGDDNANGLSWDTALQTLQKALELSKATDEIWVTSGTYYPSDYAMGATGVVDNKDFTFHIPNGVAIYGGFNGTETQLSERDWIANPTILSGDINSANDITDNVYHVVFFKDATSTSTVLDGFTIKDGNAINTTTSWTVNGMVIPNERGAGVLQINSNATFSNNIFTNNEANFGAGMFNDNVDSQLNNCTFDSNHIIGAGNGGGIYSTSSSLTAQNSTFTNNTTTFHGAAIYDFQSNTNYVNTTFDSNHSGSHGGAIAIRESTSTFNDCTITNNISDTFGGAIFLQEDANLTFTKCIISNNKSESLGGAIFSSNGISTYINCIISENIGLYLNNNLHSGSVLLADGNYDINFTNCSIIDNGDSAPPKSNRWNFIFNTSSGTIPTSPSYTNLVFNNTVLHVFPTIYPNSWSPADSGFSDLVPFGSNSFTNNPETSLRYPAFTQSSGTLFVDINDADGPDNEFRTLDDGYMPAASSILIDAGNSTYISDPTDITYQPRVFGSSVDVGAYETQGTLSNSNSEFIEDFIVYPNPVKNELVINVQLADFQFRITTIQGQLLTKENIKGLNSHVDCSKLASGIYLLTITQNGSEKVIKFIKE